MIEKYALFKVLSKIIKKPKEFSVRGLAKEANVGLGTSKTCLDYLLSKKILLRKIIGNTYQFSVNKNSILAKYIKILLSLNEIEEVGIVEELIKKYPFILSVILYGSVARGEDIETSDIDILIITRKKFKLTHLNSEDKIKREITFLIYDLNEWREKSKKDKVFYDRIILDGIALYGEIPVVK